MTIVNSNFGCHRDPMIKSDMGQNLQFLQYLLFETINKLLKYQDDDKKL